MTHIWYYEFPLIGRCGICEDGLGISRIFLPEQTAPIEGNIEETALLRKAGHQLEEYFSGRRTDFDLPLSLSGTAFQKQTWSHLLSIPYGTTISYGDLANSLEIPQGAQAVGQAVGANPVPVLVPCHRVIGKNGAATGYSLGIERKQRLLDLEQLLKTGPFPIV